MRHIRGRKRATRGCARRDASALKGVRECSPRRALTALRATLANSAYRLVAFRAWDLQNESGDIDDGRYTWKMANCSDLGMQSFGRKLSIWEKELGESASPNDIIQRSQWDWRSGRSATAWSGLIYWVRGATRSATSVAKLGDGRLAPAVRRALVVSPRIMVPPDTLPTRRRSTARRSLHRYSGATCGRQSPHVCILWVTSSDGSRHGDIAKMGLSAALRRMGPLDSYT